MKTATRAEMISTLQREELKAWYNFKEIETTYGEDNELTEIAIIKWLQINQLCQKLGIEERR